MYIDGVLTNWWVHPHGWVVGEVVYDGKGRFPLGSMIRTSLCSDYVLTNAKKGYILVTNNSTYLLVEPLTED